MGVDKFEILDSLIVIFLLIKTGSSTVWIRRQIGITRSVLSNLTEIIKDRRILLEAKTNKTH